MNKNILNTGVQNFIQKKLNTDIMSVLLKKAPFPNISTKELVEQIEAKKKCKKKLPTWYNTSNIYYPNKLNIEQTSSEVTAEYKAKILTKKTLIDLTGGFGVDSYFFSKYSSQIWHCEKNENLSKIASHNYQVLNVKNIKTVPGNGIDFLKNTSQSFGAIYADPSRRSDIKGKVFLLSDCEPNIPENLDILLKYSDNILIKTAPLLDISAGLKELHFVKEIHVVAVENDVKELLWIIQKNFSGETQIKTVNFKKNKKELFEFVLSEEKNAKTELSNPLEYLYEPNTAILKSGGFKVVAKKLQLFKLHKHTHLYTSKHLIDFTGKTFKIEEVLLYNKKAIKKMGIKKANVISRNFPISVAEIRKNLKISDGGDIYLFFTTNSENQRVVIKCARI